MTKDRIKELQRTTSWPRVQYRRLSRQYRNHEIQTVGTDGTVPFTAVDMDDDHTVAESLAQIDLIRLLVDKVEEITKDVEQIHRKMLDPMADPKLAHEVDDKTADIKKLAYDISTKLKKMERIQEDQSENEKASAQWRIKELQLFDLTRRFREIMNQYNLESVAHRERCKKSIMREFEITGNKKTNDEIEEMLETGFPGTFSFSIMVDIEKAKQAASEIEARHRDIAKLESSIKELHDMFTDLARLVVSQGEMIDSIEHNVLKAADYVEDASKNVKITVDYDNAARKKKICIIIIVVTVVIILLLLVSSYLTIKRKIIGR